MHALYMNNSVGRYTAADKRPKEDLYTIAFQPPLSRPMDQGGLASSGLASGKGGRTTKPLSACPINLNRVTLGANWIS